jgi:hypothetical protein
MATLKKPQRILLFENLAFLAIILLSWANEFCDLPRLLFGGNTQVNWRESATGRHAGVAGLLGQRRA